VRLRNLADMEALIDREITSFFQHGGVGLKSTSAPRRPCMELLPSPKWYRN